MKGKEAAKTANRRLAELTVECERLTASLRDAQEAHRKTVNDLKSELRTERANHMGEASRLAAEEVRRRLDEVEAQRRKKGLSDDIVIHMLYRTDRFILNACRYVSMTTGLPPFEALASVLAWKTDKDVRRLPEVEQLIELGIPTDGWVAQKLKGLSSGWRRTRGFQDLAVSLDHAYEKEHPRIHKGYRPEWYPRSVEYGGIELVGASAE